MTPEQLGPYRIVGTLGRGGMGAVYHGIHVETDEPAAIKILAAALSEDADFRQRFEAEIETLKKLYHPNIVQLFGFGEQGDILFYAMEYVDGISLEDELRQGRVFGWREVAEIGVQTCRALRHAHDRGIIHRDIKPANLLLTKDGRIKLSDFGIARLFGNTRLTTAGSVLGTAEYMAPEQAEAKPVGPRTDLYSLGCVLYCLLARRPPFRAKSLIEMLDKHRLAQPEPVTRLAPETPVEFERLILQLLEKDPDKRIPSATLVARRIEAMLHALSVHNDDSEQAFLNAVEQQLSPPPVYDANRELPRDGVEALPGVDADPKHAFDLDSPRRGLPADELPPTRLLDPAEMPQGLGTEPLPSPKGPMSQQTEAVVGRGADWVAKATRLAEELPETRATDAFNIYDVAGEGAASAPNSPEIAKPSEPTGAVDSPPAPLTEVGSPTAMKRTLPGRFVVVAEDELDAVEPPASEHPALVSLQTWSLALTLLTVGLTIWYFLQPPTADKLYERITRLTRDKTTDSLLDAEQYFEDFLKYYPSDPRAEQFLGYRREIALYRLKRKFEDRAKKLANIDGLLPIERAYLEAMNYTAVDPERGLEKIQALVDLYKDKVDLSGPAGQCLALARRDLESLRNRIDKAAVDGREELDERLQHAENLQSTDPETSWAMLRSIVALYQDKPWAKESVAKARKQLEASPLQPRPLQREPPQPPTTSPKRPS
jgi:serine/threonine-protein kinase